MASTSPAQPSLRAQLEAIEREYGKGTVMLLGDRGAQLPAHAIPTGALSLDAALGIGGVPRGRIVEIFGPESSGKTTLVYHIIAEAQRQGGKCAFIDAEHSMDPGYAKRIGVDTDALMVSQPDYGEQALQVADMLVRSHELAVVCVDSVAALTPRAEVEGQMGDQIVGLMARMMSQAMRKLAGSLYKADTLCVFTNQLREKIGVMFGSPETTPGGRALRFYASQRLDIRRIETVKDGGEAVANRVRVKVVKNKLAPPFRQAEFELEFGTGISMLGSLLDMGLEHGVIARSGAYFAYGEQQLGQGRGNAKAYLAEHADVAEAIEADVRRAADLPPLERASAAPRGDRGRTVDDPADTPPPDAGETAAGGYPRGTDPTVDPPPPKESQQAAESNGQQRKGAGERLDEMAARLRNL